MRPQEGVPDVDIVRCSRHGDLQRGHGSWRTVLRFRVTGPLETLRALAGGDARLFGFEQGRRLPHLELGALTRPRSRSCACSARPARGCACSTAAAARSAAAAGPPTKAKILAQPGGAVQGSIRITEQGEVIAAKYATPELGRRNLEIIASATMEATLLAFRRPGAARRLSEGEWRTSPRGPSRPIAISSTRRRASRTISGNRPSSARSPTSTSARDPPSRTNSRRIEDLRRHPLGVRLGAVAPDAAGLVRLRLGGGELDLRGRLAHRDAARDAPGVAVLPGAPVERRHGAGEVQHRHRLALCRARLRPGAGGSRVPAPARRVAALDRHAARHHRADDAAREEPAPRPLDPQPIPHYLELRSIIQVELPSAATAPATWRAQRPIAPGHHYERSTVWRRGCANSG